jgi:DNA-binding MarR family transcriptional regulator
LTTAQRVADISESAPGQGPEAKPEFWDPSFALTVKKGAYTLIGMGAAADLAACRNCHCLAARRYARAITRLYERRLRPHGLRATQFSVLARLALKGPTPIRELAEVLGLERTTLTRVAAVLGRNGWIAGAPSPDARAHPLRLTGAGRRKVEAAFPAWKQAQDWVGRRLKGQSIAQLTPNAKRSEA